MGWWVWIARAWAAGCTPVAPVELDAAAIDAEAAYRAAEGAAFLTAVDRLVVSLPCVEAALPTAVVAHVHRAMGLRAWAQSDAELASAHFSSARIADPAWAPDEELLPGGSAVRAAWDAASAVPDGPGAARPRVGELLLDGRPELSFSPSRPVVFQYRPAPGGWQTTLVPPGSPLPEYRRRTPRRNTWLAVGAAALATSVGLHGAALASGSAFGPGATFVDPAAARAARSRTNTLAVAAVGGYLATAGVAVRVVTVGAR